MGFSSITWRPNCPLFSFSVLVTGRAIIVRSALVVHGQAQTATFPLPVTCGWSAKPSPRVSLSHLGGGFIMPT